MTVPPRYPSSCWHISPDHRLDLARPRVIAILNITPDSFSDGGQNLAVDAALAAAQRAAADGADMLDIGGESTRPGAARVPPAEQIARIVPVIQAIRSCSGGPIVRLPISVDTTQSQVAAAALDAGAQAINDVSAGMDDPDMLPLAASRQAGLVLMHRLKPPEADRYSDKYDQPPTYLDVVEEVGAFLEARCQAALAAGVSREALVIDPGLGFGKTVEQNLELVRRSAELLDLGYPLLSAASRKSFVGRATGLADSTPGQRLAGSIAVSIMHYIAGARLFRVHDVEAQSRALLAAAAIQGG